MHSFLESVFLPGGALQKLHPYYEYREDQLSMAEAIGKALFEKHHALIEAGTGIGKTLAYLTPALFWAIQTGKRIVISTHTITLQEQLLSKDIPLLFSITGQEVPTTLVKGMNNYLCLQKLENKALKGEVSTDLKLWSRKTTDGSRSDIPFLMTNTAWNELSAESKRCLGPKCNHFETCFFFQARRRLEEAKILIVNHHLLLSDLFSDHPKKILPEFHALIIDEAHHFESVVLHHRTSHFDSQTIPRIFQDPLTLQKLELKFTLDIPHQIQKTIDASHTFFQSLYELYPLPSKALYQDNWPSKLLELSEDLLSNIKKTKALLNSSIKEVAPLEALELQARESDLEKSEEALFRFLKEEKKSSQIRWVERTPFTTKLSAALIDVTTDLEETLFSKIPSISFCSATLSTQNNFSFVKKSLGLTAHPKLKTEQQFPSPFPYERQMFLGIPTDIPLPQEPSFTKELPAIISKLLLASQGGAFVLFTSYDLLETCYEDLKTTFPILKQGDFSRTALLEEFKLGENNILFGTDSFWEGVDVPGKALRTVIITKLPFLVPDDPILQGKSNLLLKEGHRPFETLHLPEAILKFKQGFGRLMRRATDFGSVISLDKRLVTKSYGKSFLNSLPKCPIFHVETKELCKRIEKTLEQ